MTQVQIPKPQCLVTLLYCFHSANSTFGTSESPPVSFVHLFQISCCFHMIDLQEFEDSSLFLHSLNASHGSRILFSVVILFSFIFLHLVLVISSVYFLIPLILMSAMYHFRISQWRGRLGVWESNNRSFSHGLIWIKHQPWEIVLVFSDARIADEKLSDLIQKWWMKELQL